MQLDATESSRIRADPDFGMGFLNTLDDNYEELPDPPRSAEATSASDWVRTEVRTRREENPDVEDQAAVREENFRTVYSDSLQHLL